MFSDFRLFCFMNVVPVWLLGAWLMSMPASLSAQTSEVLEMQDGTEIPYTHYAASGGRLFIWIAPEAGLLAAEQKAAYDLSSAGNEVWYPDLFAANFLPVVTSSVEHFPSEQISALLNAATGTGKQVYFVTSGRGVIPVLRGLRDWQQQHPDSTAMRGLILFSPKFFVATPDPGQVGEIMPIVEATNLPVFIVQPKKSPWYWKLDRTLPALRRGGSEVFVRPFANVRDRFYYRPDATRYEQALAQHVPTMIRQAANLLAYLPSQRQVAQAIQRQAPEVQSSKKERTLTPLEGMPIPPALGLKDLQGRLHSLQDYRGEVVMVNFWASWCPPCVYEMPSMQRLKEQLKGKPFRILAVNMAEDVPTIQEFLNEKVSVDFSILLDSDGAALKRWGVFAFPTTYFIDKQGRLRYGLFGGREWDKPDVLSMLKTLIDELP